MFKQLKAVGTIYENYMINRGRVEARRILLMQDDKSLADIGISRQELLGGVKNWPWDGSVTKLKQSKLSISEFKAIRDFNNYSDRELQDIGINRGMIADAVKNGRPGYEQIEPRTKDTNESQKQQVA